ncbi:GNAT family N-acetyltransferase [Alkalitalea saponilacus]|uniref:Putative acetyltransferase n=1 Tax=Alkalitalea saponilacus TaxID=889453 RepID=A0A1T5HUF7_9BACT|nr:GNAT family N-acetyltransferase [Alkalitalea saponilacus]ASB50480.1 GNAT family N-acetyltransferase [Alkalitalea saponilacus]SKC24305.1 putative acetyltransferase [Alkalitalea saponilacus]
MKITEASIADIKEITQLFYETIQEINSKDYPKDEIDDWSSWHEDVDRWAEEIVKFYFIVAKLDAKIVGIASLATDGYLDLMFVHKDFQRQGIAKKLLDEIEKKASEQQNDLIYSDVSITAKGFFEKYGFKVEKQQLKKSKEKELINFKMTKKMTKNNAW